MKTRHTWQPHLSRDPFYNPFAPVTQHSPMLDHIEVPDSEEEQDEAPADSVPEQAGDQPSGGK